MIVVDTSALCAVVLGEPDAESCLARLTAHAATGVAVSAATLVEAEIVVTARQGGDAARDLHLLLDGVQATVEPVTAEQAGLVVEAWRRFGKGRHPAGLNLGDCFSYALARLLDCPLLFKGGDFTQTDVRLPDLPAHRYRAAR